MKTRQLILDWRPFEQFSTDDLIPMGVTTRITSRLEPTPEGTRLVMLMGKPRGAWLRCLQFRLMAKFMFGPQIVKSLELLSQRVQQDLSDGKTFVTPRFSLDTSQLAAIAAQALADEE
jgi:hypothetical protein